MKKSISIFLSILVSILTVACGDNEATSSAENSQSAVSTPTPAVSSSAIMAEKLAVIEATIKQLESANAESAGEIQKAFTEKMAELDEAFAKSGKQLTDEEQAKFSETLTKYRVALKAAYSRRG